MELIDQKIEHHQTLVQHHQAILVDLKIQRNRLAPISRLPPEMLYNIFIIISQELEGEVHGLAWVKLTYVCQEWRNLALSSPSLWSKPYFNNPAWAKEMLIRSKTANLTIQALPPVFSKFERRNTLFNALKTHMPKIKTMLIIMPTRHTDLFEHLPESATNLESLTLRRLSSWSEPRSPIKLPRCPPCGAVRLRQLDMSGIGIDWDVHLPSSLTSLRLFEIHPSFRPTIAQVWDTLERMPLLETLELRGVLPTLRAPIVSHRTIRLDHLRNLTVQSGFPAVECFLQTVLIPPTSILCLQCFQDNHTDYLNVNEIIALMGRSTLLPKTKYLVMRYLCEAFTMSSMKMQFLSSPLGEAPNEESEIHPPFHFKLSFSWYHEFKDYTLPEQILQNIRRHLSLDFLTKLDLYGRFHHFSPSTLINTFGSLPHLQDLLVRFGPSILDALQSNLTEGDIIPCASFPSLRYLKIKDTLFRDQPRHSRGQISIQNLIDCLTWRFQHGAPVQGLDFEYCGNLNDCDLHRFNAVQGIANVKWDGHKRAVYPDSDWDSGNDGTESDSDF